MLDISSLQKAFTQLQESLVYCESDLARQDTKLRQLFRAAAIQAFEYTFELSIKMLRRKLEISDIAANIDQLDYRELLRIGAEKGFIDNPTVWFTYRNSRNMTAHTYNEEKAEAVYKVLPEFIQHVSFLIAHLQK